MPDLEHGFQALGRAQAPLNMFFMIAQHGSFCSQCDNGSSMAVLRLESQDPCNGIPKTASLRLQPKRGIYTSGCCIGWRLQSELEEGGGRENSRNQIAIAILRGGRPSRWLPDPRSRSPQLAHFPRHPVEGPFAKTFYFNSPYQSILGNCNHC